MESEVLQMLIDKIDPINLVLVVVIVILSWLLHRALTRVDSFAADFRENSVLLSRLTTLIESLVYGRKKDK